MMKRMFKNALLMTLIGSVVFLFSCNEDKDPVVEAPVASFSVSVDGATASFTNTSSGEGNTYEWDFGDGARSTSGEATVTKMYTEADTYMVTLTATNEGGESTATEEVVIDASAVDTEAPLIILADGTADIEVNLGDTYVDSGVTATDNVDGTLTDEIVVGGDAVNTEVSGTYVITYDVTDAAGNAAEQVTRTVRVRYPSDLVVNGDFQGSTTEPWYVNFGDNTVPTQTNETNSYFLVNIETANAAEPFVVNLSQVVTIEQGKTYKLSFNASSDVSRGIIAGIGLAGGSFANNTKTVAITTTEARYELDLVASFGEAGVDNRVIFDLAAETGVVVLDNIKLEEIESTTPVPTDAPTAPPARDAADVISIYGEAYGTAIGLNNVDWDEGSNAAEEAHADNNVLKLSFNTFLGTDLASEVDASGMTHVHMDFWIADDFAAGQVFLPKWSNHNGAEETDAFEYTYAVGGDDSKKWLSIDVPLADWNNVRGAGAGARANLKQLIIGVSGTLDVVYLDNLYFYNNGSGGGGGGGGGSTGENLCVNGDFETGDTTGWTSFAEANNGTFTATNAQANGGTYSGLLKADVAAAGGGASFPVVKQANLAAGSLTAGASVTVSFDMYGSVAGDGGVVFVQIFSEQAGGGVSKEEFIVQPPDFPTSTWTNYSYTTTLGADVTAGVTLQFKADCGANANCVVEAYFDNVSLVVNE